MRSRPIIIVALTLMLSVALVSDLAYQINGTNSIKPINISIKNAPLNSVSLGNSANESIIIYYFWAIGCSHCAATEPFIDSTAAKYPETTFLKLEVTHNVTNYNLFIDFNNAFNTGRTTTPSIFIENEAALVGPDAIRADLESTILRLIAANNVVPPTAPQDLVAQCRE